MPALPDENAPISALRLAEYGSTEQYTAPVQFEALTPNLLCLRFSVIMGLELDDDAKNIETHSTFITLPMREGGIISGSYFHDGVLKTACTVMPFPNNILCALESVWQIFTELNAHEFGRVHKRLQTELRATG